MRLEDMKNDIPETPDFIHNMIQNEVAKQLADNKVANLRRRKRWTVPKVASGSCVCADSFHGSICRSKSVSLVFGKTGFLWCFSQN